jgi:hypothetical protein
MVSPIGIEAFFSKWGLAVMGSELLWVWLPPFLIVVLSTIIRAVAVRH